MEPTDLKHHLSQLFNSHEIPFDTQDEWIIPFGQLPAIRATWYPRDTTGVFEVEVLLDNETIVNECFSGSGTGEEGILSGLENFCVNSFHVLLSALWNKHYPEQVEIETWDIKGRKYNAYIGNFGTRSTSGTEIKIPEELFQSIEHTIKQENLKHETYWFRLFFGSVSGDFTFEALQNNEDWKNGMSALKSLTWAKPEGYYSVRNFIMLTLQ